MSDIKFYKITGHFRKTKKKMNLPIVMEVKAMKPEDALETVYSIIGSKHRVKRAQIYIPKENGIVEISMKDAKKNWPTTAAPAPQDVLDVFEKLKDEGYTDILALFVSSDLSGTLNVAHTASSMIEDINIHLIDTRGISSQTLLVIEFTKNLMDQGLDPSEIAEKTKEFSLNIVSYFSVPTLKNLMRGGRVGVIKYRLGTLLNKKPILAIQDGKIQSAGTGKGIENGREKAYQLAFGNYDKSDVLSVYLAHTLIPDVATEFKSRILEEFPKAVVEIVSISFAVSIHSGPEAIIFSATIL